MSCDPLGVKLSRNSYLGFSGSPMANIDPNGMDDVNVVSGDSREKTHANQTATGTSNSAHGAAGTGGVRGAPSGPTARVSNLSSDTKMMAMAEAVIDRRMGRVTNTVPVRAETAHRAAETAFKNTVPQPTTPAPGGKGWG